MSVRHPMVVAFTGASFTTGRLACPDLSWVPHLITQMSQQPECKGQVIGYNMGLGSQTSDWGVTNAPEISKLRPTHILFEGFGINDCAIGPVTLTKSAANFQSMVQEWRTNIPGVDLTHQTMSPAASDDVNRTTLQSYYNQELALAASLGISSLNHTPDWPAITAANTNGAPSGDKLHPLWSGVFEVFSYPTILAWAKARMATFWP